MFSTLKQRLLLGIYIFLLLSIPVGAYLASQQQTISSSAGEQKSPKSYAIVTPKPKASSAAKQLLNNASKLTPSPIPAASSSTTSDLFPTVPASYGPTLSLKVNLEGRPTTNQTGKVFVGLLEGSITANPKFLLSFTVDMPASGVYSNLSLAGLTPGNSYTAIVKGSAQIAASVAFIMSPAATNLNEGAAVMLTSGDLNDDNVVNTADYTIMQKVLGTTTRSANWNSNADFNKDGVINAFDLSILVKNLNAVGSSGVWTSPIPKLATPSASLNSPPVGSPDDSTGYWLWLPK